MKKEMNVQKTDTKKTRTELLLEEFQKRFRSDAYTWGFSHGGICLKLQNNKRAFEVTKKRDNTYKVCCHKDTALTADLVNTVECITQQNNYKFDSLSKEECFFVCSELLKAKKTIIKNRTSK